MLVEIYNIHSFIIELELYCSLVGQDYFCPKRCSVTQPGMVGRTVLPHITDDVTFAEFALRVVTVEVEVETEVELNCQTCIVCVLNCPKWRPK